MIEYDDLVLRNILLLSMLFFDEKQVQKNSIYLKYLAKIYVHCHF